MISPTQIRAPQQELSTLGQTLLTIAGHQARTTLERASRDAGLPPLSRGTVVKADPSYRTLLAPDAWDTPEFQAGHFYVCTHGDHWCGRDWRISVEEVPVETRALSTPTLLTWPTPETWNDWNALLGHPHLHTALDILRIFATKGHWQNGSRLPLLLDAESHTAHTQRFWETLRVLARDGTPPDVAVTAAARL